MLPGGLYARVSTEDQATGKPSVPSQIADVQKLFAREGVKLLNEYVDDSKYRVGGKWVEPSARRSDRPAWQQMLADADAGLIKVIGAWDHTRLYGDYRPATDFLECVERNNLKVLLVNEAFQSEFGMLSAWARRMFYKQHEARTEMGRQGRAKRGLALRPGMAYVIVRNEKGESINYSFNPQYRDFFDEAARLFLDHKPYAAIARQLRYSPFTGRPLSEQNVRSILLNPFYRGLIRYGLRVGDVRISTKGVHEPAWDEETCRAIESEIARREVLGKRVPRSSEALFAGLVFCGQCGFPMSVDASTNKYGTYLGYICHAVTAARRNRHPEDLPSWMHPPHHISERKLVRLLQEALSQLTPADVDGFLAGLTPQKDDSPRRLTLERQIGDAEQVLGELLEEIELVKSQAAKRALQVEQARIQDQIKVLREEQAKTSNMEAVDHDEMRRRMLRLIGDPDLWGKSRGQLRQILRETLPAIYVARGEIVRLGE